MTIDQARADVDEVARGITREAETRREFMTTGLKEDGVREIRGPLLAIFAGVGILLLIACVNVASLLVARAASRSGETALRLALGATRGRLLRQALVEGLLLTAMGAAAGVFVGFVALRLLLAFSHLPYDDLPNWALPYSLELPIQPDALFADARAVSPGLLEARGVRLLEWRFFTGVSMGFRQAPR